MFLHSLFLESVKNKNPGSGGIIFKRTTKGASYVAGLRAREKRGNMGAVNVTALMRDPCETLAWHSCATFILGYDWKLDPCLSDHRFTVFSNRDLGSGSSA